jgi:hypothetical protein
MKEELTAHDQSAVRSKLPAEENLVHLRDTQIVASDTRERYRQKIARITLDSMVQFVWSARRQGRPFWTTFWWQVSKEINATLRR